MSIDRDFEDLMELYNSSTESLSIKSINLNEVVLTSYKDRVLVDVFETHHKANRMQLAIEKKDVLKLIEFLQKINK
tara:strand:+ start:264 stop:491 length:228 start_codon:yes stop_codon:yes gene_type:complete